MDDFQSAYQEEKERLDRTLATVDKQLEILRGTPIYTGHDYTEQILEDNREDQRRNLAQAVEQPYFGRLDFEETGKSRTPLYIGKVGVGSDSPQPLVIDWRAPVASLFYSFTGGDSASYIAPEGEIDGLVYLKRNIMVRKQILERVVDTYNKDEGGPAVSDEFLLYRLGENKDNKLRDIVSTIQAEQDQIIRAGKNTALIIQGVAGSGKTTVALHRLAFLLYQYKEQMSAERMVIFAPNHMFLDYISDVLPELGVGDIQQNTFNDWAAEILGLDIPPADGAQQLTYWFDTLNKPVLPDHELPGRYKGSLAFKDQMDIFLDTVVQQSAPQIDFSPWEDKVLPYSTIMQWYEVEYHLYPPAVRKERVLARLHRWIEMEFKKAPSATVLKEWKKKATQREKAYVKKWPELDALTLYKAMFGVGKGTLASLQEVQLNIPSSITEQTRTHLKKGIVKEEDVAALLYLHTQVNEINGKLKFDHVVIDEAQDYSPLQVAVLDRFVKGHSFTILGDLSQGIHHYRGIKQWGEMMELFGEEETAYFALTRSYRSTMEIISFANEILSRGVDTDLLAVPVFRSGEPVRFIQNHNLLRVDAIERALKRVMQGPYRTCAILTRTLQEAKQLYGVLLDAGVDVHLMDGEKRKYEGGISVLPVYLSKGLEFDAVLITDVDAEHYGKNDAKLLYVGCTRALHELWLLCGDEVPNYAQPSDTKITVIGWPEES